MRAAASTTWPTGARWSDVILGVEYQHFDVSAARAFCVNPGCVVPAVRDFDLSASGDIVRARLTIKTHGYGFGPSGGVGG